MAAAAQQAQKKTAGSPMQSKKPERGKKGGAKEALQRIPQAAGVVIMLLLLGVSLFVGNFRALSGATPKDFIRQGDVKSIIEDRIDAANNAMTVAKRAGLDDEVFDGVDHLINSMEGAKTAREISRADQDLTAAVVEIITAAGERLDDENRAMLQSAADDFAEMGSFLRQEARAYNKKAEKAEALYEKLPTRFVLPEPDVYEGL